MAWKRSILLFGLPLVSSAPANHAAVDSSAIGNWEEVVDSSRAALQEKVQDVFEDARNAIDAMRSNAPATTAAIVDAEREAVIKDQLRKRQDTNTTITSVVDTITVSTSVVTTTPSSSIETPTTSSEPATTQDPTTAPTTTVTQEITPTTTIVAPTTTAPTTTAAAPTTEQSSAAPTSEAQPTSAQTTQAPQTSEARPTTTTNIVVDSDGSIVTSVPPLATATDSEGDTVVLTSPTPGAAFTTEDQSGNVAIVTYTPGGGTVSEVRLRTTTLPNGNLETVTSYATAGAPADPTGEAANSQESDGATLQNGAAGPSTSYSAEIAVLLGAAFGVAGLLL